MKALPTKILAFLITLGVEPTDDDETRLKKAFFTPSVVGVCLIFMLVIGPLYIYFDESVAGMAYIGFSIYAFMNLILYGYVHKNYWWFSILVALGTLPCHLLAFIVLGGFVPSGGIILWGLGYPVAIGVILWGYRVTLYWFAAYVINVLIAVSLEPSLTPTTNVPEAVMSLILAINILLMSSVMVAIFGYFISQRDLAFRLLHGEQVKSENLLLNILPSEIAAILKNENRTIADYYEGASILFADVVNFTPLSASMTPVELVNLLNEVFSHFDTLVEKYGLEKIKTIGDCYMVASGVPRSRPDHAQALVRMALEMQKFINENTFGERQLRFRMGINSGAVVAGVIGRKKFIYDLWGDAVNTASRMESHGDGGTIQITRATYDLIQHEFDCEARGTIKVKGKGEMETWHVIGETGATS